MPLCGNAALKTNRQGGRQPINDAADQRPTTGVKTWPVDLIMALISFVQQIGKRDAGGNLVCPFP